MQGFEHVKEQIHVAGKDLAAKLKELIHEGNVRRIIVKDENGHTFMEIPLSVAAIGVIAAPIIAAAGAIATVVAKFTVVVERSAEPAPAPGPAPKPESPTSTDASVGATEAQEDMAGTVSQSANEAGGTGEPDAQGG